MKMVVSCITEKEGKKAAYILFEDEGRSAEALIPDCKVIKNQGFTEEECAQLEQYLIANLAELKKQAANLSPLKAMLKDKE